MNNTMAMDMDMEKSALDLNMSDIEITELDTENAFGIPELGASIGSSFCCTCCCA